MIPKLDDLLCNECLYSYNNINSNDNIDDSDSDNHGYNDNNDTSRTLSRIYQDLISWSKAIDHCSLLSSCTNGNGNGMGNTSTNTNT